MFGGGQGAFVRALKAKSIEAQAERRKESLPFLENNVKSKSDTGVLPKSSKDTTSRPKSAPASVDQEQIVVSQTKINSGSHCRKATLGSLDIIGQIAVSQRNLVTETEIAQEAAEASSTSFILHNGKQNLAKKRRNRLSIHYPSLDEVIRKEAELGNDHVSIVNGEVVQATDHGVQMVRVIESQCWPQTVPLLRCCTRRKIWHPYHPARQRWDFLLGFFLLYTLWMVPFTSVFTHAPIVESSLDWKLTGWRIGDLVADVFFMCDCWMNFHTAFYSSDDATYIFRRSKIARHYIFGSKGYGGWFLIDFPTSIPIGTIMDLVIASNGNEGDLTNASFGSLPRLLRLVRLFRLAKLLRIFKLVHLMKQWEGESVLLQSVRVFNFLLIIFFTAHIFACMWMAIALWYCSDGWWDHNSWPARFEAANPDLLLSSGGIGALNWCAFPQCCHFKTVCAF